MSSIHDHWEHVFRNERIGYIIKKGDGTGEKLEKVSNIIISAYGDHTPHIARSVIDNPSEMME